MTRYIVTCDYCQAEANLAQPGRFCSPRHRSYWHRDRLLAQRLAAEADAALRSGDVLKLEHVARETARLLAVQRRASPPPQAVSSPTQPTHASLSGPI